VYIVNAVILTKFRLDLAGMDFKLLGFWDGFS